MGSFSICLFVHPSCGWLAESQAHACWFLGLTSWILAPASWPLALVGPGWPLALSGPWLWLALAGFWPWLALGSGQPLSLAGWSSGLVGWLLGLAGWFLVLAGRPSGLAGWLSGLASPQACNQPWGLKISLFYRTLFPIRNTKNQLPRGIIWSAVHCLILFSGCS